MTAFWSPAAVCIAVAALAAAVAAGWWSIQEGREAKRRAGARGVAGPDDAPARTAGRMGARPALFEPWMVVTAALLIAGLIIMPRLFGITFLLLPFLFGRRRPPQQGPRPPEDDSRWSSME